jgi:hypothetical protein
MTTEMTLIVWRRLDNRLQGLPDDSPEAWELHRRRAEGLHEALDASGPIQVVAWGDTDDEQAHESVELLLAVAAPVVWDKVLQPGLIYVAKKLGDKLVDQASSGAVAWLVGKLRPKQQSKKILDYEVTLPSGIKVTGEPLEQGGAIRITMPSGEVTKIEFEPLQPAGRR